MKFSPLALFLSLLTGGLMAVGFPPYENPSLSWIPFVAFAPLCWALLIMPLPGSLGKKIGFVFLLGFIAGSTFFLLTFEWITSVAWEGLATLPFYLALYTALWAVSVLMIRHCFENIQKVNRQPPITNYQVDYFWSCSWKNLYISFFAAASWTALEWARGMLFTGFGWNSFGVAFHHSIPLLQLCDLTGIGGLSFLGVMTGCMTALVTKRLFSQIMETQFPIGSRRITPLSFSFRPHGDVFVVLLLLVGIMSYGLRELMERVPLQEELSIAAVQGNIPQDHKWDRAFEESILSIYERQSELALALHPDLVVWPEAATPRPLLLDQPTFNHVKCLAQKSGADFLIGSLHFEENPRHDYNAAILLTEGATHAEWYAKTHLLPFGEYIPLRKSFPLFAWIAGDRISGDFDEGPGPRLFELSTKAVKIAPLICFEDTLGDLVRRFAGLGAQAFINLTNDGWFGHTAASEQHLVNALFRCAETKLPMLRVANTGVTCVIDRFGRVVETLHAPDGSTFLEGMLATHWKIPQHPAPTFYTKHGDLFAKGCLVLSLAMLLFCFLRKSKVTK